MRGFRNIVLTGASGGLGQALARELAAPDKNLLIFGRDTERLARARELAEAKGASVASARLPLEKADAMAEAIRSFDERHPVDLFVANAGVKCGNAEGVEADAELSRVVTVNLAATIASVQAVLPGMMHRGRGRIVLISSLAAISPQASLLSYSATKAGVRAYGIALRRRCIGSGVGVTVVLPGFIDTPMTDRHLGPTPAKISAKDAARRIARGAAAGRGTVVFPLSLSILARFEALLPTGIADRIALGLDATILPDGDEGLP